MKDLVTALRELVNEHRDCFVSQCALIEDLRGLLAIYSTPEPCGEDRLTITFLELSSVSRAAGALEAMDLPSTTKLAEELDAIRNRLASRAAGAPKPPEGTQEPHK
jgi:hypothetical protein